MPFQQRTNTSCYLAIPTHGFTVVLAVFRGTPPAKPLKCKSVSNRLGARFRQRWTESTGGKPRLSCAWVRLVLSDIIKTSFSFCSQCFAFRCHRVQIKNPASVTVSRVGKSSVWFVYLLAVVLSGLYPARCLGFADRLRLDTQPPIDRSRRVACATDIVGHFVANMFLQVFIERSRRIAHCDGYIQLILRGGSVS